MSDIEYDSSTREVKFIGYINSNLFYDKIFKALKLHYNNNASIAPPIISLIQVDYIDPLVLPNLVGLGIILNKIHHSLIPLKFSRVLSTKFLEEACFFDNVGNEKDYCEEIPDPDDWELSMKSIKKKIGLSIYDFDERVLGFYNNQKVRSHNNPDHKLRIYQNESLSYYLRFTEPDTTQEQLDAIRTDKFNRLKPFVKAHFSRILNNLSNPERENFIIRILTEIICNSVLYSDSISAVMLHSKDNKVKISISDFGVGFEYSFALKRKKFNYNYTIVDKHHEININFLYIFETLDYSKSKCEYRENLYSLVKEVVNSNDGIIRIHYIDTQVTFSSKKCKACTNQLLPQSCLTCAITNNADGKQHSSVKTNFGKLKGVHIEVELNF